MRNKALSIGCPLAELRLPTAFTNVKSRVTLFLIEQQSVILLPIGKSLLTSLTGMSSGLNIPFNHFNWLAILTGIIRKSKSTAI